MELKTVKTARRKIIWILILSILCLFLISFLPWISVLEEGMVKENLHFNYEMMRQSTNEQIYELSVDLMNINILFWTIIVISLISFIFITYHALVNSSLFSQILIVTTGCITFAIIIIIVYHQIIFSRLINNIDYISASMINSPFAYAYIQFIISIILLIYSGSYTISLVKFSIKHVKNLKKQTKKKTEIYEEEIHDTPEDIEKSLKGSDKLKTLLESDRDFKLDEIDKLLAKNTIITEKQISDDNQPKQELEKDEQIEIPSNNETIKVEDEIQEEYNQEENTAKEEQKIKQPFPPPKPKKKSDDTDEIHISEHFEKALSSAIEKKQIKIKPQDSKEKDKKQDKIIETKKTDSKQEEQIPIFQTEKIQLEKKGDTINKIFNLKCPECNHIFPFKKETENQKITCPKCGKEGGYKKEF